MSEAVSEQDAQRGGSSMTQGLWVRRTYTGEDHRVAQGVWVSRTYTGEHR